MSSDATAMGDWDPEAVAVRMEYTIFLSVKTVQVYKLSVHKKVRILYVL